MITNKLQLPQVTLIALTGLYYDVEGHRKAVERSCEGIEFGDVKIIMDKAIKTVDDWNYRIIYDLWKYVNTEFAFLFHADGYIIHPELWQKEWLELDYIGAPWPLPTDDYSYRDSTNTIQRMGNSISLRSRRLMEAPSLYDFEWKSYYGNTNEDGFLCVHNRQRLEELGMKFATFEQALKFGKEHELPENKGMDTFCFHQAT